MWLFLPFGFYSIVDKAPNKATKVWLYNKTQDLLIYTQYLCVRSRDKQSLLNLRSKLSSDYVYTDIIDNQGSDYQYRMWVHRKALGMFLSSYAEGIDYSNFKNKAEKEYKSVFSRVWGVLWDLVPSRFQSHNDSQLSLFEEQVSFDDIEDMTDEELDAYWDNWGK